MINAFRLDHLRTLAICCRSESAGLSAEFHSASVTPVRKKEALKRYSEVVAELRTIGHDLGRATAKR